MWRPTTALKWLTWPCDHFLHVPLNVFQFVVPMLFQMIPFQSHTNDVPVSNLKLGSKAAGARLATAIARQLINLCLQDQGLFTDSNDSIFCESKSHLSWRQMLYGRCKCPDRWFKLQLQLTKPQASVEAIAAVAGPMCPSNKSWVHFPNLHIVSGNRSLFGDRKDLQTREPTSQSLLKARISTFTTAWVGSSCQAVPLPIRLKVWNTMV